MGEILEEQGTEPEDAENGTNQPGVETFSTAASKDEGARKIKITYNFGQNLDELAELHSKESIYGMAVKALKVAMQGNIRTRLSAVNEDGSYKYSDEEINNFIQNEYKPGVRAARVGGAPKSEVAKLAAQLKENNISIEDVLAMLKATQPEA